MTSSASVDFFSPKALITLAVVAASCFSPLTQAQQVFRSVGPDGKVTFSDQAPPVAKSATIGTGTGTANSNANAAPATAVAGLPYEMRQLAGKYPVTLYTSYNCQPCNSGRALLTGRGIPFTEKTITTAEDNQALQRLSGVASLPFLTLGSQQIKGFSDAEWTQYLDAAGYPASSRLPASYRAPPATPLVALAPAPGTATKAADTTDEPAARPVRPQVQPSTSNPAGIRF